MKKTALITGASSGIGLELAHVFAQNGHNLVLVARSTGILRELASQLGKQYGITVHVFSKDLGHYQAAAEIFEACQQQGIQVDYLVNNAGFGDFSFFHQSSWAKQEQMINLNITALTYLTRLFVDGMVLRKYGKIMNVASTAAFQPGPTMSVYYATKAYVLSFSEALSNELKDHGITVTALCPGGTESGFQDKASLQESKLVKGKKLPSSKEVAIYGYNAMMKGKTVAIHGLMNAILANAVRFMPRSMVLKIVRNIQGTPVS